MRGEVWVGTREACEALAARAARFSVGFGPEAVWGHGARAERT